MPDAGVGHAGVDGAVETKHLAEGDAGTPPHGRILIQHPDHALAQDLEFLDDLSRRQPTTCRHGPEEFGCADPDGLDLLPVGSEHGGKEAGKGGQEFPEQAVDAAGARVVPLLDLTEPSFGDPGKTFVQPLGQLDGVDPARRTPSGCRLRSTRCGGKVGRKSGHVRPFRGSLPVRHPSSSKGRRVVRMLQSALKDAPTRLPWPPCRSGQAVQGRRCTVTRVP